MSESGEKQGKQERRFSQEQYDMLKRCSEKKDMTEWNEWREKNPDEDILLEGAQFAYCKLRNKKDFKIDLTGAVLHLDNGRLAKIRGFHLENANFNGAYLKKSFFVDTQLKNANFINAKLENVELSGAHLEGAKFGSANLKGVRCQSAIVNASTVFGACRVDRQTDFRNVALDSVLIEQGIKQLLKYNIRRMNWEDWYKEHWFWRWPVRLFWAMSDYGMSTVRVVGVFFLLALLFAAVYMNWAYWAPPGIVSNLVVRPEVGETALHYFGRALIRPVYFSVVTMTTLGFGDMYANKGSIAGHVILAVQVILGYVLLGALITRFAVLFTAGGPAGRFAESRKRFDPRQKHSGTGFRF